MAFFRFNRDRRGYEHFYLVEPVTNRRGKTRPRVLYWYRTPPNVRVGRAPFDQEVQRALETYNPNVTFDWKKIVDAPIPSADVEKWRERRRVERAEKARLRSAPESAVSDVDDSIDEPASAAELESAMPDSKPAGETGNVVSANAPSPAAATGKRRRRRRGRRRGEVANASGQTSANGAPHDANTAPPEAVPESSGD